MRGWTNTIVNLGHVCNVRLIGLVEISTVPATGKLNLGTKAIWTICSGHVRGFRSGFGIIDAGEANSVRDRPRPRCAVSICHGSIVIRPCRRVSRDHFQTGGERDDIFTILASAQVVHHSSVIWDIDKRAIGALIVQQRCPVRALVLLDGA